MTAADTLGPAQWNDARQARLTHNTVALRAMRRPAKGTRRGEEEIDHPDGGRSDDP